MSRKVLLVEDNEDNHIVATVALEHAGYIVVLATNGQDGIDKARSEKPGIILMDISIPIIDGLDATAILKQNPETWEIPIVAVSAHAFENDRLRAIEAGCCEYLVKPYVPKDLVALVGKVLGIT